jgi:hypothetical protein
MRSRSLSPWDGHDLARRRLAAGIVAEISAATVRRLLAAQPRQPWRHHRGLHAKPPRDAAFSATVAELIALDTRPLRADAMVLCREEKTSLPPRPRPSPPLPAPPPHRPNRGEHADTRAGALPLLAALDPRSGTVDGPWYDRKRHREFIAVLDAVQGEVAEHLRTRHLGGDHVSTPHGNEGKTWWAHHPRGSGHFTAVHGSWMKHVDQWGSIRQRQRWRLVDVASTDQLRAKLDQFIPEWNQPAHPLNWSTTSVAKIMAAAPALAA